jgi:hypothetical protein
MKPMNVSFYFKYYTGRTHSRRKKVAFSLKGYSRSYQTQVTSFTCYYSLTKGKSSLDLYKYNPALGTDYKSEGLLSAL